MISFKVFDNSLVNENKELINYINSRPNIFLEYTFYNRDNKEIIKNQQTFLYKESSLHLNSKHINLINFNKEEFLKELSIARFLNSRKLIIHPEKNDIPKRLEYQYLLVGSIVKNLKEIVNLLEESETIYIENVRFDIDFYKILFEEIKKENLKQIGFCFDIGHGKTFSQYSFNDWFLFLEYLDSLDIDIYFHIHANEGFKDEHKPFSSYKDISILNDDLYTSDILYDLERLFKRFEDKWFSLELMPSEIINEINFLIEKGIYLPK